MLRSNILIFWQNVITEIWKPDKYWQLTVTTQDDSCFEYTQILTGVNFNICQWWMLDSGKYLTSAFSADRGQSVHHFRFL